MPRVRPRPRPQPKEKEAPPPPPAPDSIDWEEIEEIALNKEAFRETDLYGHFTRLKDIKDNKCILIYFYWPDEDADSDDHGIANQVRRCKLMDGIFDHEEVRRATLYYHCYKCNAKELSDHLKHQYKIKLVPKVLFFDNNGNKKWQLTNTKAKPEGVAEAMMKIVIRCGATIDGKPVEGDKEKSGGQEQPGDRGADPDDG